jgi:hypothetical protein
VQTKIGQKRYRTALEVQRRAGTQLRHSAVGKWVHVEATPATAGCVTLRWWVDRAALVTAMRADGRYLLVTNDPGLTPTRMLALYRDKDAVEKRFRIFKQDLRVRPVFVHSDERLRALLLINLIALLAYSLLERQARQQGLCLTAHRILEQLAGLQVIELEAWDGSRLRQVSELTPTQARILILVWRGLSQPGGSAAPVSVALLLERYRAPATVDLGGSPRSRTRGV